MTGAAATAHRPATAAFGVLLLAAFPAFLAFDWHHGLAGLGDDSVSYVIQAQLYSGTASDAVRAWAGTATHFPPLFPLLLAALGAGHDLLRAHLVVATCAVLALPAIFAFAARATGERRAALALVAAFLLTPTAWISTLGVLSDPPYLLASFAFLAFHRDAEGVPSTRRLVGIGLLLAAVVLTRSAGLALVAAFVAHGAQRIARRQGRPRALLLPLAIAAAAGLAWIALRAPLVGENYGLVLRNVAAWIARDPMNFFVAIARQLANAWVASFTAEPVALPAVRAFLVALALCAVAGAARAARAGRLDGWYALAYLAMLSLWLFPQEIMRRLLYPVLPLALLHAGELLVVAGQRLHRSRAWMATALAALLALLLSAPALVATAQRARDRVAPVAGCALDLAGMTAYYTTVAQSLARAHAGRDLAVLAGVEAIATRTPVDAHVMWMRPDYVALLGERVAVPWLYREGFQGALVRMRDAGVTHVVVASVVKGDLDGEGAAEREFVTAETLAPFTRATTYVVDNAVRPGEELRLVEIDRPALLAYLGRAGSGVR